MIKGGFGDELRGNSSLVKLDQNGFLIPTNVIFNFDDQYFTYNDFAEQNEKLILTGGPECEIGATRIVWMDIIQSENIPFLID